MWQKDGFLLPPLKYFCWYGSRKGFNSVIKTWSTLEDILIKNIILILYIYNYDAWEGFHKYDKPYYL